MINTKIKYHSDYDRADLVLDYDEKNIYISQVDYSGENRGLIWIDTKVLEFMFHNAGKIANRTDINFDLVRHPISNINSEYEIIMERSFGVHEGLWIYVVEHQAKFDRTKIAISLNHRTTRRLYFMLKHLIDVGVG
jgi:hypothetical protein